MMLFLCLSDARVIRVVLSQKIVIFLLAEFAELCNILSRPVNIIINPDERPYTMEVQLTLANDVATILLDDGKVNALSEERLNELRNAMTKAKSDNAIVVIKGRPGIFSAGFDMNTFASGVEPSNAMVSAGVEIIIDIINYPRPVVIHCTGHAFPMGAFLLLSADLRIGTNGDYQIGLNETAIKIPVPDFALALARARLSPAAYANIVIARLFEPREAVGAGYLDVTADADSTNKLIEEKLSALRVLDQKAFRDTKARMNAPLIKAIRAVGLPKIAL